MDYGKLQNEMAQYTKHMKNFLPVETKLKELLHQGLTIEQIKETLGEDSKIINYVPQVLYHGSKECLDVIKSAESTQAGSFVYATDNPVHALFFSIFRNSSICRAHIREYIDENGEYQVKYEIDERVAGALNELIDDSEVTIHVCNGNQFFKPQGGTFITREWVSKNGENIVPTDKIKINVKDFFAELEKQNLVTYDHYDKSKDCVTILDMLGQNYAFGLGTMKAKNNIDDYDTMYDEFINKYFPEQLAFSQKLRGDIKKIYTDNYKSTNPNLTDEQEMNLKLKNIKDLTNSFLLANKTESGKVVFQANNQKISEYMAENYQMNL